MESYDLLRRDDFNAFWKKAATVPQNSKPEFSDDFKSLVWDMLKYDPKKRITMENAAKRAISLRWYMSDSSKLKATYMQKRLDEFKRDKALDETLERQRQNNEKRINQQ